MTSLLSRVYASATISLVAFLAGTVSGVGASRVAGTDLLGSEFTKALYAGVGERGLEVALTLDGSRPGAQALKAGRADAALLFLPQQEAAELREFQVEPVAYQRVLVLVRENCPIASLSFAHLAEIFGRSGTASAKTWGGLSGINAGSWSDRGIAPIAPEVGQGIALDLFRQLVLSGGETGRQVARYRTRAELRSYFEASPNGIALAAGFPGEGHGLKALAVAAQRGAPVGADAESLAAGRYTLSMPLLFAARREALSRLEPLRQWLRSDAGKRALEQAELFVLPRMAGPEEVRK